MNESVTAKEAMGRAGKRVAYHLLQAVVEGLKVIEKYNCGGCHQIDFDTWDIAFKAGELGSASKPEDYPFMLPHFTPQEIDASLKTDRRQQSVLLLRFPRR